MLKNAKNDKDSLGREGESRRFRASRSFDRLCPEKTNSKFVTIRLALLL